MAKKTPFTPNLTDIKQYGNQDYLKYLKGIDQVDATDWLKNPSIVDELVKEGGFSLEEIQDFVTKNKIDDFAAQSQVAKPDDSFIDPKLDRIRRAVNARDGISNVLPTNKTPVTNISPRIFDAQKKIANAAMGTTNTTPIELPFEQRLQNIKNTLPTLQKPMGPMAKLASVLAKPAAIGGGLLGVDTALKEGESVFDEKKPYYDRLQSGLNAAVGAAGAAGGLSMVLPEAAPMLAGLATSPAAAMAAVPAVAAAGADYTNSVIDKKIQDIKDKAKAEGKYPISKEDFSNMKISDKSAVDLFMEDLFGKEEQSPESPTPLSPEYLARMKNEGPLSFSEMKKNMKMELPKPSDEIQVNEDDLAQLEQMLVDDNAQAEATPEESADEQIINSPQAILAQLRSDLAQDSFGTRANLTKAQELSNLNRLSAILNKAGAQVGGGIAGLGAGSAVTMPDAYKELMEGADVPLQQYEQIVEGEKTDPSSKMSQMYRDAAKIFLNSIGINSAQAQDFVNNASARDLEKVIPSLNTYAANRERALERRDKAQNDAIAKKQTEAGKIAQTIRERFTRTVEGKQAVNNAKTMQAVDNIFNTLQINDETLSDLETKDFVGMMKNPETRAKALEALSKQPALITKEISVELANALVGGRAARGTIQDFQVDTLQQDFSKWLQYITSKLKPAKQGEILEQYLKAAQRVKARALERNIAGFEQYIREKTGNFSNNLYQNAKDVFDEYQDSLDGEKIQYELLTGKKYQNPKDKAESVNYKLITDGNSYPITLMAKRPDGTGGKQTVNSKKEEAQFLKQFKDAKIKVKY